MGHVYSQQSSFRQGASERVEGVYGVDHDR